jgi:Holliday junction resolvase
MIESEIQHEIMDYLKALGYLVYRMNAGSRQHIKLAIAGTPDILVIMDNSKVLWIEVKQPGKEPTDIQKDMHEKLRLRGQRVIVAHSLDEVISAL